MKTRKAKGIPCANMKEFDAVMDSRSEASAKPKVEHTQTPWHQEEALDGIAIYGPDQFVCKVGSARNGVADAAFIVKAVNAHDELVKVLKKVTDPVNYMYPLETWLLSEITQALAKAEAE